MAPVPVILRDHDDGTPVPRSWGPRIATILNDEQLVDDLNPTGYPQVVEELSGAGVVAHQYTYGLQRISENQVLNGAWTPSFYGYDGGGNVRQLTNSAGTVTDAYEYDAFGNSFTKVGATPNNYLYRGEQFDPDLGLYYLRARYYNPATGRFMSRDPKEFTPLKSRNKPLDSRRLHKYSYASGDPVNLEDPRGEGSIVNWILAACLAVCPVLSQEDEPEHIEVVVEFMEEVAEEVELDVAPLIPPEPWTGPPPTPQFPNPEWGPF